MVGRGVLLECLDDARVERVLIISRTDLSGKVTEFLER